MHVAMHRLMQATAIWRSAGIPRNDSDSLTGVEGLGSAEDGGFSPGFGAQVRGWLTCMAHRAVRCHSAPRRAPYRAPRRVREANPPAAPGRPPAMRASRSRTCRPRCATSCCRALRANRRTTSHRTTTSEGAHLHACSHDHQPLPHTHTPPTCPCITFSRLSSLHHKTSPCPLKRGL